MKRRVRIMLGSSISMGAANTLSSTEAKDVLDNILLTMAMGRYSTVALL
mgnify:CR=1 FL=1